MLISLLPAALLSAVLPQTGFGDGLHYIQPAPTDDAAYEQTVAGEFTGDHYVDLAVLVGGEAYVHWNIATNAHFTKLVRTQTTLATGLTALPGFSDFGLDTLVLAQSSGVYGWQYEGARFVVQRQLADWRSATNLVVGDLNDDGDDDLIALDRDRHSVHIGFSSGEGDFPTEVEFTYTEEIVQIGTVNWLGSGLQLAVMLGDRVEILDSQGTLVQPAIALPGPADLMQTIQCQGEPNQSLVLITRDATNLALQWISVAKPGQDSWAGMSLGPLGVTGVTAGDMEVDGDDELWLSHTFSGSHVLMINVSDEGNFAAPPFSGQPEDYALYHVGPTGVGQVAQPVSYDLDGDSDRDLIVPVQSGQHIYTVMNPFESESSRMIFPAGSVTVFYEGGYVEFDLEEPGNIDPSHTHLQVVAYRQQVGEAHMDAEPVDSYFQNISPSFPEMIFVNYLEESIPNEVEYAVVMRTVALDENGVITDAGPASISNYVADDVVFLNNVNQIPNNYYKTDEGEYHGVVVGEGGTGGAGAIGGASPRPNLPPLPPGGSNPNPGGGTPFNP